MKNLSTVFFLLISFFCSSQNLVPNGNFELYSECPSSLSQIESSIHWINPTTNIPGISSSPDFFHSCATSSFVHIPANLWGEQEAHSDSAYSGIILYTANESAYNYREYIETPLTDTLESGQCYQFEMYVNLGDNCQFTSNDIQVYFSDTAIIGVNNYLALPYEPQLSFTDVSFNSQEWTLVSGEYLASGGETHMIIGNFNDYSETSIIGVGSNNSQHSAYVYIDDVSLTLIPCYDPCNSYTTETLSACDSLLWIDGITYTTSNDWAFHILDDVASGCDSVISLDLTILSSSFYTDTHISCGAYDWIDGNTYTSSNSSATYILTNSIGCDSIVTLDLTISPLDSSITQIGETLVADEPMASYQWINCSDMANIEGAIDQSFTPTNTGSYAVIVSSDGCSETSECYDVVLTNVNHLDLESQLLIYPNPIVDALFIELGQMHPKVTISITDISGRLLESATYHNISSIKKEFNHPPGLYILSIEAGGKQAIRRIIQR